MTHCEMKEIQDKLDNGYTVFYNESWVSGNITEIDLEEKTCVIYDNRSEDTFMVDLEETDFNRFNCFI